MKQLQKNKWIIVFSVLLIIIAIVAFFLVRQSPENHTEDINNTGYYTYNGYDFAKVDGLWVTRTNHTKNGLNLEYVLKLHYSPKELQYIQVNGNISNFVPVETAFISFSPEKKMGKYALAISELSYTLANGYYLFQPERMNPTIVCSYNAEDYCEEYPIVNCSDKGEKVVSIEKADTPSILVEGNCTRVMGSDDDIVKVSDKLIYLWLGIMNN